MRFEGAEGEQGLLFSGGGNSAVLGSLQKSFQAMQAPLSWSAFQILCRKMGDRRGETLGAWDKAAVSCCGLDAPVQTLQSNSSSAAVLQPIFLNEVLVKLPTDPSGDEPIFHISHIDRVYTLRAESINER